LTLEGAELLTAKDAKRSREGREELGSFFASFAEVFANFAV
jgi:hypothetical protein